MRSTFTGLEISKRSLFAQQAALQTTGHNISNANTRGYSRQVVNMVSARPLEAPGITHSTVPGQIGQGVEFDQITRIRETFLDHQYYNENQSLGEWTVRKDTLEKLEAIVNEPSDTGIRKVIEGFWNAWQVVSKEPENVTGRASLKEKALALTDAFNHAAKQMNDLDNDLKANIVATASEANTYLEQIAGLNKEINRIESMGDHANDFRDQRDLAVDDLSRLLNVTVDVDPTTGSYNVKMGTTDLVNGFNTSVKLVESLTVPAPSPAPAIPELALTGNAQLTSGEIKGMVDSRGDKYLGSYKFQLDAMVKAMATGNVTVTLPDGTQSVVAGVNGLHKMGYTLKDLPGLDFFTTKDGSPLAAANITVNAAIVNDVSNIAASMRLDAATGKVVKGNNDIALLIAGFKDQKLSYAPAVPPATGAPILTNGTVSEFYTALVGQVGVQSAEAQRQAANQQLLVDQVDSRRQSVSGVSLDEEMSNMIKYQHAYNAAARALTTFDEMLDKVINGMGLVGR